MQSLLALSMQPWQMQQKHAPKHEAAGQEGSANLVMRNIFHKQICFSQDSLLSWEFPRQLIGSLVTEEGAQDKTFIKL